VAPELGLRDKTHADYKRVRPWAVASRPNSISIRSSAPLSDWYVRTFHRRRDRADGRGPHQVPARQPLRRGPFLEGVVASSSAVTRAQAVTRTGLRECWGFDCLYGDGQSWFRVGPRQQKGIPLYFYFGQGNPTRRQRRCARLLEEGLRHREEPDPGRGADEGWCSSPRPCPARSWTWWPSSPAEDIGAKAKPGKSLRGGPRKVDPLLDNPAKYWSTIIDEGLKDHYPVVSELLGPCIKQSLP